MAARILKDIGEHLRESFPLLHAVILAEMSILGSWLFSSSAG